MEGRARTQAFQSSTKGGTWRYGKTMVREKSKEVGRLVQEQEQGAVCETIWRTRWEIPNPAGGRGSSTQHPRKTRRSIKEERLLGSQENERNRKA